MGWGLSSRRGRLPRPHVCPDDPTLTQFWGMVPLLRFLSENLKVSRRLRAVAGSRDRRHTFAVHHVLFAFAAGALAGVHRLAHLEWIKDDAVLLKLLRPPRIGSTLPGSTDFASWLLRARTPRLQGYTRHGGRRLSSCRRCRRCPPPVRSRRRPRRRHRRDSGRAPGCW